MVDPATIIEGIRQFGLAPDGSDLRDLEVACANLERQLAEARAEYLTASKDAMELAGKLNTAEAERDRLAADNARLRDGFAEPDVMAMSNGVISLHYEDLDAAQSAFDWLEARAMGEKK